MKKHTAYSNFHQMPPSLVNEYTEDEWLQDYLTAYLPADMMASVQPDLVRFGKEAATTLMDYAIACEKNPPQLISFDAWGNRIDEIKTAPEWKKLEEVAAREGLVAIGYERKFAEYSRLYQFVKVYLYTPSSAIYSCPLAMSDGAARLIENYGDAFLKGAPFKGLTSRDPEQFLTSGQWMTERSGGSDVARSMTIAQKEGTAYVLRGHKWFTSAITANMAFTLACTAQSKEGERAPLSLFYLPIRREDGSLNGMKVEALKNKLGTKALPTAQIELVGARARLVSDLGKGIKTISTLFNVTRIYNTITAVSYMRRAYSMAEKYSHIRVAFGKKLDKHILHKMSLRKLEIDYQSNALLGFYLTRLLGKDDCKLATSKEIAVLRLLTPVAKLFTAKGAICSASEEIECFGGLGYLEDSNIPVLLRDAQVLSIWEGTTNVLSLDMLRAIAKDDVWSPFVAWITESIKSAPEVLKHEASLIEQRANQLFNFMDTINTVEEKEGSARAIAFYVAELSIAILWLDFVEKCPKEKYKKSLNYWLRFNMKEEQLHTFSFLSE